jgi:hypothetical protein
MDIDEAFAHISEKFQAASRRGIEPSVRVSGPDWVCTIEDKQSKFVMIAKEGELTLVTMELKKGSPDVQRIFTSQYAQQEIIDRIQQLMDAAY